MADGITICEGCAGGADLARRLEAEGVAVQRADCLNVCKAPVSLSVRAEGKAAYLFAGVDPAWTAEIRAFLALYAAAEDGLIEDARPCGALRHCLIGRIPA